jgi:hypothetical protein
VALAITLRVLWGEELVYDEVQPDNARATRFVEVAADGVSRGALQFLQRFRLREDGVAEGSGFVAALGRFVHRKDDFAIGHRHDSGTHYKATRIVPGAIVDHWNRKVGTR